MTTQIAARSTKRGNMPRNRKALCLLFLAVTFAAGVCAGRQTAHNSVDQFLVPSQSTELDRMFMEIQLQDIRNEIDTLEEINAPAMPGIPGFFISPKTGKVEVLLTEHKDWIDKQPLKELQSVLVDRAQAEISLLKFYLKGLSEKDIEVTFAKRGPANEIVNDFAEYKNGELTIKH